MQPPAQLQRTAEFFQNLISIRKTHSQKIIPMIKTVLKMIEGFTDIDLYAASTGQGLLQDSE